jgi:hypothetical protein
MIASAYGIPRMHRLKIAGNVQLESVSPQQLKLEDVLLRPTKRMLR